VGDSPTGIQKEKKLTLEGQRLADYIAEHDIDELIVACDERRNNLPLDLLFDCKIRGTNIIEILDFIERETGQVAVNLVYPSWVIYSNGFSSTNDLRNALDWSFNAVLSLALLLVAWPLMLIAWLAIKLEDGIRAPTLFFQERVGLDGRVFPVIKFRSMRQDAEKQGAVWATKDDPRVTRTGKLLRKYRVDELPQLWNVLRGDMGFVGPRPERPEFVKDLIMKIPYYNQRHNVKPGLTGWAQLKYPYGASEEDALEKLKYDLYYVKHRSFLLDLNILVQTVEVVLFGKGR
jgi:sugar transferase (PEP-CTERM system associated)